MKRRMRWFGRSDREYAEEIEEHIAIETQENIGRGMTSAEARLAARRTFGNPIAVREQLGAARPLHWLGTLAEDIRYGVRSILRSPLLAGMILVTLTAGIGLNTGVFTVINALGLRAQVDRDPGAFFSVFPEFSAAGGRPFATSTTYIDYLALRRGTQHLGDIAASAFQQQVTLDGPDPVPAQIMLVSCNFFQVYGLDRPLLGRLFLAGECAKPGSAPVAILSENFWTAHFNSDPGIIGRTISLSQHALTVVGVVASSRPSQGDGAIWVPLTMGAQFKGGKSYEENGGYWLKLEGRLQPGHSRSEVASALRVMARQQDRLRPGRRSNILVTDGAPMHYPGMSASPILLLVLALPSLVLLIACVNVSTLLLARGAARQREMAVRISLGAGRVRLVRMLLTESLVLASGAAALSLWMAYHVPAAIAKAFDPRIALSSLSPDWTVFGYVAAITLATGCVAGLAPAAESLRVNLSQSLKGQQMATDAAGSRRTRGFLVACQVAMSLLVLSAAGLFAQAEYGKWGAEPDYETRHVLLLFYGGQFAKPDAARAILGDLEARLRAAPGVGALSFTGSFFGPLRGQWTSQVTIGGASYPASATEVSPEYFHVLGIPILRGRTFTADEDRSKTPPPVAIVTEGFAKLLWPGEEAVGKKFHGSNKGMLEVVGVTRDTTAGLSDDAQAQYFVPRNQDHLAGSILLRFAGEEKTLQGAVMRVLAETGDTSRMRGKTLRAFMETQNKALLEITRLLLLLGGLAMVLAVVGIYGVSAFGAAQRTRELGIRTALGANRTDIVRLIVLQGIKPVLAGLAAGLVIAAGLVYGLARVLGPGNSPVTADDPRVYAAVTIILALAAVAAMFGPAHRAASSDPLWALRQD